MSVKPDSSALQELVEQINNRVPRAGWEKHLDQLLQWLASGGENNGREVEQAVEALGIERAVFRERLLHVLDNHLFAAGNSPHATLGLKPTAAPEAVRDRFHRLAQVFHPDRRTGESSSMDWWTERTERINQAYSSIKRRDANSERLSVVEAYRRGYAADADPNKAGAPTLSERIATELRGLLGEGQAFRLRFFISLFLISAGLIYYVYSVNRQIPTVDSGQFAKRWDQHEGATPLQSARKPEPEERVEQITAQAPRDARSHSAAGSSNVADGGPGSPPAQTRSPSIAADPQDKAVDAGVLVAAGRAQPGGRPRSEDRRSDSRDPERRSTKPSQNGVVEDAHRDTPVVSPSQPARKTGSARANPVRDVTSSPADPGPTTNRTRAASRDDSASMKPLDQAKLATNRARVSNPESTLSKPAAVPTTGAGPDESAPSAVVKTARAAVPVPDESIESSPEAREKTAAAPPEFLANRPPQSDTVVLSPELVITELLRNWSRVYALGDADLAASFFTENAVDNTNIGRTAIRESYARFFDQSVARDLSFNVQRIKIIDHGRYLVEARFRLEVSYRNGSIRSVSDTIRMWVQQYNDEYKFLRMVY